MTSIKSLQFGAYLGQTIISITLSTRSTFWPVLDIGFTKALETEVLQYGKSRELIGHILSSELGKSDSTYLGRLAKMVERINQSKL